MYSPVWVVIMGMIIRLTVWAADYLERYYLYRLLIYLNA